jgi:hypothetical protein
MKNEAPSVKWTIKIQSPPIRAQIKSPIPRITIIRPTNRKNSPVLHPHRRSNICRPLRGIPVQSYLPTPFPGSERYPTRSKIPTILPPNRPLHPLESQIPSFSAVRRDPRPQIDLSRREDSNLRCAFNNRPMVWRIVYILVIPSIERAFARSGRSVEYIRGYR